jgi:PST family polysaccharide transporter
MRIKQHRQIIRSTSIIGGASVAQILIGIFRMKAAALLIGATGVGLIGLYYNFVLTAATIAGLGIGSAATRHIAAERARSGGDGEAGVRHALISAALILGLAGAALVFLLRGPLARLVLGNAALAGPVGWLALGIALTVVGGSLAALLTALRQTRAIGWTFVGGALVGTVAGIAAIYLYGTRGIVFFVVALPLGNALAACYFVLRLPRGSGPQSGLRSLAGHWSAFAVLGLPIMFSQILANAAPLAVRSLIGQRIGLVELGLFNGAWSISTSYLGVVLQAMGTDFYPRLTESIGRSDASAQIVNEQTEMALLLAGPIIVAAIGFAPLGLHLLYSAEFRGAADLLRWQMLGDVLKVASWPMGFVLLAGNRGRAFFLLEAIAWFGFVGWTWLLVPALGLKAAGVGLFLTYLVYLPLVFLASQEMVALRWSTAALKAFALVAVTAMLVFGATLAGDVAGMVAGAVATLVLGSVTIRALRERLKRSAHISPESA